MLTEISAHLNQILEGDCRQVVAASPIKGTEPSAAATGDAIYGRRERVPGSFFGDAGSAARFFYCAKASRAEKTCNGTVVNNHPTVKPLELCRYLVRLTVTPTGGIVLDPFAGSGSIPVAVRLEGRPFIGIEQEPASCQTARARLAHLDNEPDPMPLWQEGWRFA